jgi:HD-like signal output (HDOD) protein
MIELREAVEGRLTAGEYALPPLPEIAARLMLMIGQPEVDFDDLERLVGQDPIMAARILKVANSSSLVGRRRVETLRDAITRVGTRMLARIALSTQVGRAYEVPGCEERAGEIWQHAQLTSDYATELAWRLRANPEACFLSGLLHTVGYPVVLKVLAEEHSARGEVLDGPSLSRWLEAWGAPVGEVLAASWALPESVQCAVRYHADPLAADGAHRKSVLVTSLASVLATCQQQPPAEARALLSRHPALTVTGLLPADLVAIQSTTRLARHLPGLSDDEQPAAG